MVGPSSKILLPMIRIAITARPLTNAIRSTLPEDASLWPVIRQDGQSASRRPSRPSEGHAAARRESFDYEFAAEPPLLHRERLDGGQQLGLSPGTLNLINAHVGDARLPESKRYGGLRRNVDHSATDRRSRPTIVTTTLWPLSRLTTRTCDPIGRLRCAATSPVKREY
jgi:hypothetical protein